MYHKLEKDISNSIVLSSALIPRQHHINHLHLSIIRKIESLRRMQNKSLRIFNRLLTLFKKAT